LVKIILKIYPWLLPQSQYAIEYRMHPTQLFKQEPNIS
jgi:hypothetical protein